MSSNMNLQVVHNREFLNGDRVVYYKVHHSHQQWLKAQLGNKATVVDVGRHRQEGTVKYLVRFDKPVQKRFEWWIAPRYLRKVEG